MRPVVRQIRGNLMVTKYDEPYTMMTRIVGVGRCRQIIPILLPNLPNTLSEGFMYVEILPSRALRKELGDKL